MAIKTINSHRVFWHNNIEINDSGEFVLYWMQINRRFHYNFSLEYAVSWANKLNRPLVILESLISDYPWISDRFHAFFMEGMQEHKHESTATNIIYYPHLEGKPGESLQLAGALAEKACLLVTDEFPAFIMRQRNRQLPEEWKIPYCSIDSNGLIPLGLTKKAPYSAYQFRRIMQQHFVEAFTNPPKENPLDDLNNSIPAPDLKETQSKWPVAGERLSNISEFISELNIDHTVKPLNIKGTREAALSELHHFNDEKLKLYGEKRNDPDYDATSRLSPWLHFGLISEYEIVKKVLEQQPAGWNIGQIVYQNGKNTGFFGGHDYIEKFLDELITWRETGFHFCHHTPGYDQYESLPDWVLQTLEEHSDDVREYVYSLNEFEEASTHDLIWNAAQRQLVREGYIHNYLRMLWGKKILEWTSHPEEALNIMSHLNNKYAIDGRDPNSYTGIFWVLGRFDRPWFERPVFGKVRYMSSESAKKKVKMNGYLEKFGK